MSTDLSLFGHLSRPLTRARPASFGRWRHVNRFPSLGSPRTPTCTPTPTTRGGTRRHEAPQPCRDWYSGRHPPTQDNTSNGALENRKGRQALGGSNPSPSGLFYWYIRTFRASTSRSVWDVPSACSIHPSI